MITGGQAHYRPTGVECARGAARIGNATTGTLTTAYDGAAPGKWQLQGAVLLGTGGDNSNSSWGTFFEGAITAGQPTDATDDAVHANIATVGYGK